MSVLTSPRASRLALIAGAATCLGPCAYAAAQPPAPPPPNAGPPPGPPPAARDCAGRRPGPGCPRGRGRRAGPPRGTLARPADLPARPGPRISILAGALRYDYHARSTLPMAALRADWPLRRWLRGEVGLSYALGDVAAVNAPAAGGVTATPATTRASLLSGTVGLLAEVPGAYVRPYVGVAGGLFGRFDDRSAAAGGAHFVRPEVAAPLGLRLVLTPRASVRAETRFRFDQHPTGASAPNTEFAAGLSVRY